MNPSEEYFVVPTEIKREVFLQEYFNSTFSRYLKKISKRHLNSILHFLIKSE